MRRLRWETESVTKPPKRPYRDSAIFYAVLAGVIVVVALATGGSVAKAAVIAAIFFVLATGWSWWKWRQRLAAAEAERKRAAGAERGGVP